MQERQEKKRKRQRLIDSLRNKAQRAPFFFFFPGESLFDRAGKDSSYATVWLEFFGSMNPP